MTEQQKLILTGLENLMKMNPRDSFYRNVNRITAHLAVREANDTDVVNALVRLGVLPIEKQNGNKENVSR